MIGILINVLSVVLGGLFGTLFGHKLSAEFTATLTSVFGVCSLGMGVSSIVLMENMPAVILSLVIGTSVGLLCHLGDFISKGGATLQTVMSRAVSQASPKDDNALSLLVTAIVLFCASSTGIYGTLDAGMTGNSTILLSKSILDFFTAAVFACNLGLTVSAIALPQAVIFTALFAAAKFIFPLTTPSMIADFKACGGFILIATGLRIAKIKEFPVADMIPAMILVMPVSWLWTRFIVPLL